MSGTEDEEITIVGAGLAGMVASINLAREGHQVTILDREKTIGGSELWHPSVHMTPMQPEKTWEYIGINLSNCFSIVKHNNVYLYGKKFTLDSKGLYLVERGRRDSSIDIFLHKIALEEGVKFKFSEDVNPAFLRDDPGNRIIATGLYKEMYEILNIPYYLIRGWRAHSETDREDELLIYMNHYSSDYAYLSATNNQIFALLFKRNGRLTKEHLDSFKRELENTENIVFENWTYSTGCSPATTQLFEGNLILSGTLSGMIDPFYQFGILGSLISGKIASLAVSDRSKAIYDFQHFTKRFRPSRLMKKLYNRMPFKRVLQPMIMRNMDMYRVFTRPMFNGIPGFVEEDWLRPFEQPEK